MITAKPFSLTGFKKLKDASHGFTIVVHTSLGPMEIHGWRMTNDGHVHAPCWKFGGKMVKAVVKVTPHQRSLINKLAVKAFTKLEMCDICRNPNRTEWHEHGAE